VSDRHDLLWRAARTPDAPAFESATETWTFAGLAERSRRAAAHLRAVLPPGDAPIGLLLRGEAQFAAWFHAAASTGRPVLPLNLRLTATELAQQLGHSRADLLLGHADDARLAEIAALVGALRAEVAPSVDELPEARGASPAVACDDDATLAVLYTSGTSGRPKGACLSWSNFEASARAAEQRLGRAVHSRWLACMPLFHVGGLSILLRSALFGGPVRVHGRFDARAVSDALDRGDIAGLSLVPTMLSRLLDARAGRGAPQGLEALLLGGAAIPSGLLQRALAAGYPVCTTYGLTEACSQVATSAPPRTGDCSAAPMRPLRGVEIRIVDGERLLPAGEPGEIVLRGPLVMQGYLHDREATARVLRDGWLHTSDIGYLDDGGGLHVLDRRDDLVITGGENVYPAEVEAVLLDCPGVAEAGVAGVPDADLGARVVAWIVTAPGASPDAPTIAEHCRSRLASYKVPRRYHFVAALPRTAAGKLQRLRLPELPLEP
jgi:O-succinylbenzoic acid--CoA ligase